MLSRAVVDCYPLAVPPDGAMHSSESPSADTLLRPRHKRGSSAGTSVGWWAST